MMSVITQNKYGFLLHPLPPTPHVHLQLIDKPYGKHSSIPEDHFDKKKKKRKRHRTTPLNAGEASLMAYHQKVRERLLNSWKTIVELGKDVGYIPVSTTLQDGEMPKKHAVPSLTDGDISTAVRNSITIQALDEDKEHILKLCLSCTYNCIDLVDLCNNNLPLSNPTDTRTPVEINDDLRCGMYNVERLCGRVVTNSTKNWAIIKHLGAHFVIPQNCTFLLSDITEFQTLVDYVQGSSHRKYDCVVLDPPWENRSAIRSHKYQWLSERDLLQLSLPLLCNNGCLVVVWVTNKVRFADFVRDELFPSWGVEFISEWHWMKVTKSGELVFDLESLHKKPYELLLLGKYQGKDIVYACIFGLTYTVGHLFEGYKNFTNGLKRELVKKIMK